MKRFLNLTLALVCAVSVTAQTKYIFYFIGDGMGMGHVNTTEVYRRNVLKADTPMLMMTFPVSSQVRTYSADCPITDSAAAGTALSTGHKTRNNMVGMSPDSLDVYSISADFMRTGRSVGIVSSVAGDDATPAAFYAHAIDRHMNEKIAGYAPGSGVTFFGAPVFRGMTDENGKPTGWVESMKTAGYNVVYSYDEWLRNGASADKTLMLSANPQGEQAGYTLDATEGAITLQEMTETAVGVLKNDSDGFFLMVEGGNIDWAAHANDGATVIKEIINFQNAIDVAYRFYTEHPDETLIVITADHDTGGMALGREDNKKNLHLELIDLQKISKDRFADWCKSSFATTSPSWEEMRIVLEQNFGLWKGFPLTADEEKCIRTSFDETFITRRATDQKTLYHDFDRFTVTLYDILNRHYGIAFTSSYHTANFVPLYAIGADAMLFSRNLNNNEIPMLLLKAAGIVPSDSK